MKKTGIELIAEERQRQIEKEGYTLVTPLDFLKAWCPEECPDLEESVCDLIDQEFNIKIIL